MFRSSTAIRQLALNLAKVIFMLKHSVKLRRYLLCGGGFFLTIYLQHAPLHYYAILHACCILYIYVVSITFIHLAVTVPFITYQSLLSWWIEQNTLCIYSLVNFSPSARFLVLLCFLLELLSPSVTLALVYQVIHCLVASSACALRRVYYFESV